MALIQAPLEIPLVFDTDVFTHWRNQQPNVIKAIKGYQSHHKLYPALTSTTVFEIFSGIEAKAAKPAADQKISQHYRARAELLIRNCIVLPFEENAAAIAAHLFPRLSHSDRNKHWRDVFIAATALAHSRGIATGNRKDFELIASHLPHGQDIYVAVWKP